MNMNRGKVMTDMEVYLDLVSETEEMMMKKRMYHLSVAKRKSSTTNVVNCDHDHDSSKHHSQESLSSVDMYMERAGTVRTMTNMNSHLDRVRKYRVSNTTETMRKIRLHEAAKLKYPTVNCDDSSQCSEESQSVDIYMDHIDTRLNLSAWSVQPQSPWENAQLQPKPLLDFHLKSSSVKCNSCSYIIPQDSKLNRTNIMYCLTEIKHFVHCPNCTTKMVIGIPNVEPARGFKYVVGGATLGSLSAPLDDEEKSDPVLSMK